jgi:hypothetical protein
MPDMSFKNYLLVNLALLVPLWVLEANYSMNQMNFAGAEGSFPACALIVYVCIIPSIIYFIGALRSAKRNPVLIYRTATVALLTPLIVNFIGTIVAGSFGWLGAEL